MRARGSEGGRGRGAGCVRVRWGVGRRRRKSGAWVPRPPVRGLAHRTPRPHPGRGAGAWPRRWTLRGARARRGAAGAGPGWRAAAGCSPQASGLSRQRKGADPPPRGCGCLGEPAGHNAVPFSFAVRQLCLASSKQGIKS